MNVLRAKHDHCLLCTIDASDPRNETRKSDEPTIPPSQVRQLFPRELLDPPTPSLPGGGGGGADPGKPPAGERGGASMRVWARPGALANAWVNGCCKRGQAGASAGAGRRRWGGRC